MSAVVEALTALSIAAALAVLGRWGIRNAHLAAADGLPEQERSRRVRVARRGGRTCLCVAGVFVAMAVVRIAW